MSLVEYDDGIPDTPQNRKHRPAESFTTRRDRARGFYLDHHRIPIGYMRLSEREEFAKMIAAYTEEVCSNRMTTSKANS